MPTVGLFIPCYVDQMYPHVGMATLELLEQLGCKVEFPTAQTCCGQPMSNTGCTDEAKPLARKFLDVFADYEYIVAPSGSCVSMVRHHYDELVHGDKRLVPTQKKTFELCEFIVDVLKVEKIDRPFPHRVGLHQSCHGLRELRLASSSEVMGPPFGKTRQLLASMTGIELVNLERPDECCGFGGTFAVSEEAVSCMMGDDRIYDHEKSGTQVLTANDMSCLMHLQGIIARKKKPLRVMHVAEILAGHSV